jgi:hypothetical protein
MKAPIRIIALTFALLACLAASAQTTTMQINAPFSCGVYSTPTRCFNLPVTVLGADGKPLGPSGTVTFSYYAPGYRPGYGNRVVPDYGFVLFNDNFEGLAGASNSPYPYNAAITAVDTDHSLLFQGVDDQGVAYHGRLRYTFSTHYGCSGGRGGCHTSWTITGGTVTVTRNDY